MEQGLECLYMGLAVLLFVVFACILFTDQKQMEQNLKLLEQHMNEERVVVRTEVR